MTIWEFSARVTRRLIGWNLINIAGGIIAGQSDNAQIKGIASQSVGWGFINLLIGVFGGIATDARMRKLANPYLPEIVAQETRSLKRLLAINTGLDVLYMLGGWRLAETRGGKNPTMRGIGYGIILQGMLLFIFNLIHVLLIPSPSPDAAKDVERR
jgi:hypothetical protein